jgi:hypothetical protein
MMSKKEIIFLLIKEISHTKLFPLPTASSAQKNNNLYSVDLIERFRYSVRMVILFIKLGDNFKFDRVLERN